MSSAGAAGGLLKQGMFDDGRMGRGKPAPGWEMLAGKFALLAKILDAMRATTRDRIVIVSNFTQVRSAAEEGARRRGRSGRRRCAESGADRSNQM